MCIYLMPEEALIPGTGVRDRCVQPPCGCWDLSAGSLEEQPMLLPLAMDPRVCSENDEGDCFV